MSDADLLYSHWKLFVQPPISCCFSCSKCQNFEEESFVNRSSDGAAVDLEDKEGRTPLHWAAVGGITDICAMLISNGLDVAKRDKLG